MLDVELPILRDSEPIHLVVDSTGLKVYGEGEWKGDASTATRSGARNVKSISRSTRIRLSACRAIDPQFVIWKLKKRPSCLVFPCPSYDESIC
ncbi:MAG: hypothetical protein E5299_01238 [Burkholderia gladioli]|nr:MAG: hypothetical protein E5299_01238 [Burkholderia gladioli]